MSETLTPIEERILRIAGTVPAAEEPMDPLDAPAYGNPVEIPVIQDAIVIEQEAAVPIKVTLNGITCSWNFITVAIFLLQ